MARARGRGALDHAAPARPARAARPAGAIENVSAHLAEHGPPGAKTWYDERVVADDLRLHLDLLGHADPDYRELFLDRANAFLDRARDGIYGPLAAIDRLKWHLVRRRLLPELLEVLRFRPATR